jgi:hypothetical protein
MILILLSRILLGLHTLKIIIFPVRTSFFFFYFCLIFTKMCAILMVLGKGEGIVIAPHVAGHLLGGTVWKITKDGEDVVYAVDFNHRKER